MSSISILKTMTKGAYDLQQVRIAMGLRLCANFRARLKTTEGTEPESDEEMDAEALDIIAKLKQSYGRLTDGVAKNRTLPSIAGFVGDELISDYTELVLTHQYIGLEKQEVTQFRQFTDVLNTVPIYAQYLNDVVGVGPAMAAVMITTLDPHKARTISSFWKYAGLDVGSDGAGRSRREAHLVERAYTDKNGNEAMRMSVTYNPWLKTKLMGVLAASFLRSSSPWRASYDDYKHRLLSDPARVKVTVSAWKKAYAAKEDVSHLWTPGRIHKAASRYMVKMFLAELWVKWRELEGLTVTPTYHEAKLGHQHRAA